EIERREQVVGQRLGGLEERARGLEQRGRALEDRDQALGAKELEARARLEQIAGLTAQEAKQELLRRLEDEARNDAAALARDLKEPARRSADKEAKKTPALERLSTDGRIHPGRIEEVVDKARAEVDGSLLEAGEQAVYETGIKGMHPELVKLVGRMRYRTSYGQNILEHSKEVAWLAGIIA